MAACPGCNRLLADGRAKCMYCGHVLEALIPCPACKRPLSPKAAKCFLCGNVIAARAPASTHAHAPAPAPIRSSVPKLPGRPGPSLADLQASSGAEAELAVSAMLIITEHMKLGREIAAVSWLATIPGYTTEILLHAVTSDGRAFIGATPAFDEDLIEKVWALLRGGTVTKVTFVIEGTPNDIWESAVLGFNTVLEGEGKRGRMEIYSAVVDDD